jgi:hypothetical protein
MDLERPRFCKVTNPKLDCYFFSIELHILNQGFFVGLSVSVVHLPVRLFTGTRRTVSWRLGLEAWCLADALESEVFDLHTLSFLVQELSQA